MLVLSQTPVQAMVFAPSGQFALSAAEGERHLAVWPVPKHPKKKKKGKQLAVGSLPMEHPACSLDTCSCSSDDGEEAGGFNAMALSQHGEVYVWECKFGESGKMQGNLRGRIKVTCKDGYGVERGSLASLSGLCASLVA